MYDFQKYGKKLELDSVFEASSCYELELKFNCSSILHTAMLFEKLSHLQKELIHTSLCSPSRLNE